MDTGRIVGIAIACFFGFLMLIMIIRTLLATKKKVKLSEYKPKNLDEQSITEHLQEAIRYKTVTLENNDEDGSVFLEYQKFLESSYPNIMSNAEKVQINKYSVIYICKGSDSSLLPCAFLAHQDVVPAPPEGWTEPPFSGNLNKGYIYGRGTQDMKSQMIQGLEGLEYILKSGQVPKRTIYFCFGHDEELSGKFGANYIAEYLKKQNIRFEYILDEGGTILDGKAIGVNQNIALVGTCEKGYADIKLSSFKLGGHASTPTRKTAVGMLAKAVAKIEKKQMRPSWALPTKQLTKILAPYTNPFVKFLLVNREFFSFLLKPLLCIASPFTNTIMRTTIAPTMFNGATTPNTLPKTATANLNVRISSDDSTASVVKHVKKVVGKKIKVEVMPGSSEPSPISPIASESYKLLAKTISETYGGFLVAPYQFIARSDSAYYRALSDNIFRFTPLKKEPSDSNRIHGVNERIAPEQLIMGTQFFVRLIENTCL